MNKFEKQILKNQFQIMIELQVGMSSDEAKELFFRCHETDKLIGLNKLKEICCKMDAIGEEEEK